MSGGWGKDRVVVEFIDSVADGSGPLSPIVCPPGGWRVKINGVELQASEESPPSFVAEDGSLARVAITFYPDEVVFRGARGGERA